MSNVKDEGFDQLLNRAGKNFVDTFDEKNKTAEFRLTLAILGILAFVGYEAIKVIFRKNFGMTKGAFIRLILCFLCFGGIAAISFNSVNSTEDFAVKSGTSDSHLVMGIFYSLLALTILIKGIVHRNKQNDNYSGDSNLLGFLMKEGWSQRYVQNLAEPLLAIALGTAICFFDLLGGLPIIFCAISTWANLLFDIMFQDSSLQASVNKLNIQSNPKSDFHEINTN